MICKITIRLNNPAFADKPERELSMLLDDLLKSLKLAEIKSGCKINAYDAYGNRVGQLVIEED